ncbi:alpha/beta fold hydrolase [Streptomyces sp. enrichment culture]|uniref:alpha/beta fold hydrolase n=1 Tax=Streptomyces sp. enrichment culture TaxID=1795815 RepID=UPI003F56D7E4
MFRTLAKTVAAIAVVCTVAGAALVVQEEFGKDDGKDTAVDAGASFTGTKKIRVEGRSVNVSCSGSSDAEQPLVMLMAGGNEPLGNMAPLQKELSGKNRVCSYDRLGEGASDKLEAGSLQHLNDVSVLLTGVLDQLAGTRPVVLVGHSLGGNIAARYTPDHTDRVRGVVLLDATVPHLARDMKRTVPADATGASAQARDGAIGANEGQNAEQLVIDDGPVHSAGDIPVEILTHESQYSVFPEYETALEKMWADGQQEWLKLSTDSKVTTAKGTGHYIHTDNPGLTAKTVQDVTTRAAKAQ